jgi:PAP2 superfamily
MPPLIVFAAYLWLRSEREAVDLLKTFILNLLAALPIYMLIPVSGPRFVFPSFPTIVPTVVPHLLALNTPPNGIPCVHLSNALLVAWFARKWRFGQVAGVTFVLLTIGATLGFGEHYLFDLVLAVPYSMGVVWVAAQSHTLRHRAVQRAMEPSNEEVW